MYRTVMVAALALIIGVGGAVAAENADTDRGTRDTTGRMERNDVPADNTGRNVRDRGDTQTPGDQANSEPDLKITQSIRQTIVGDKSLSTNAHNVKIVTVGGTVTLRGPVASAEEKAKIDRDARAVPGVKNVDNQLEIAAK